MMNNRQRTRAILHYEDYDRLPIVHFGYWQETLHKWAQEGHITAEQGADWADGNWADHAVAEKLGFDFNWGNHFSPRIALFPEFERKIIEQHPDGSRTVQNVDGVIVLEKDDATGIPAEIDHLLKTREDWKTHYKPRLEYQLIRISYSKINTPTRTLTYKDGGREYLQQSAWDYPYGLFCGSLYGEIRNWVGLVGTAYIQADDPILFDEIIETVGELCYRTTEQILSQFDGFDFAHFWEDICFNKGPLINPRFFREKVAPHYRRITELVRSHGIDIISVDCDGKIDELVPIWLESGVNTMFPIEVGTWNASIQPWREQYGRALRGIGGMDKRVFARDYAAIDIEIERLKPLVNLGGYIPCPDHRIAPDAKWENVQYYCEKMREAFG
jgi:hypothetical protein